MLCTVSPKASRPIIAMEAARGMEGRRGAEPGIERVGGSTRGGGEGRRTKEKDPPGSGQGGSRPQLSWLNWSPGPPKWPRRGPGPIPRPAEYPEDFGRIDNVRIRWIWTCFWRKHRLNLSRTPWLTCPGTSPPKPPPPYGRWKKIEVPNTTGGKARGRLGDEFWLPFFIQREP